jgi:hypothetical protein
LHPMAFPTPTTACVDDHSEIARADELVVGDRQLDDTGNLGRHRHHIGAYRPSMPGRYRKPQADAAWAAQQRFLSEIFGGGFGLGMGLLLHRLGVGEIERPTHTLDVALGEQRTDVDLETCMTDNGVSDLR